MSHSTTYRAIIVRYPIKKQARKHFAILSLQVSRDMKSIAAGPLRPLPSFYCFELISQGPLNGGVSNGGVSRSGLVLPFCPFGTFPGIFPICPGTLRGFSRLVLFLFLGLLSAPMRNSPERVRDTIWTFPERSGKHPGLETPRFSFSQIREVLANTGYVV